MLLAGESRLAPTKMKRGLVLAGLPAALASAEERCEMAETARGSKLEEILCEGSQGGKGHGLLWEAADAVASGLPAS